MIGLGKEVVQDELVVENTGSGYQNVQSDRRETLTIDVHGWMKKRMRPRCRWFQDN